MKKISLVALAALFLSGCNGSLDVKLKLLQDVVFKDRWNYDHTLKAGEHDIDLSFDHEDRYVEFNYTEEADWPDEEDEETYIRFKFENESQIPQKNGPINLPASVSGQNVDLKGSLSTDVERSGLIRDVESCQRREETRVCEVDRNGHRTCRWEYDWVRGEQEVEYHRVTTTVRVIVNLLNPADKAAKPLGGFDKTDRRTQRDYVYQGVCHTYGRRW